MPVVPFSYITLGILGCILLLNLWNHFEPKYDEWQRERRATTTTQASAPYTFSGNFEEFMAIARLLDTLVRTRNESLLLININFLNLRVQGHPPLMVPASKYKIPY